jgi:Carboxypeptidase regulatory-like domain
MSRGFGRLVAAGLLSAGTVTLITTAAQAAGPTTGAIRGTVRNAPGGGPLPGVCVEATPASDPSGPATATGTTGSNGVFVAASLPAGSYIVDFGGCGLPAGHLEQWYDGAASEATATAVTVTAGQTTSQIDAALTEVGQISGTVKTTEGGHLFTQAGPVCISVIAASNPQGPAVAQGEVVPESFDTDRGRGGPGFYVIDDLPVGTYVVEFSGCQTPSRWQTVWFGGSSSATATPVQVAFDRGTPHINVTINFVHGPPGTIRGVVTKSPGGGKVQGLCVSAVPASDPTAPATATGTTDIDGFYTVSVPPGTYFVDFGGCGGLPVGYKSQWYQDQPTEATANRVSVGSRGHTASIDAALAA